MNQSQYTPEMLELLMRDDSSSDVIAVVLASSTDRSPLTSASVYSEASTVIPSEHRVKVPIPARLQSDDSN